jgi:E-phenylitaconyl-CoA hydratase
MKKVLHERVIFEKKDRVATITLDRADRLNAFDTAMYVAVNEALELYRDDKDLWVAIIQANGEKVFCAGADVKELSENAKNGLNQALGGLLFDNGMVTNKPILAAVQGFCVGEGVNLILGCDMVFADESSTFKISEPKIGTNAIDIPIKLGKKIGYNKAFAFLMPGDEKGALWCKEAGLVEVITSRGAVQTEALAFAQRIANEAGPLAIRAQKETLWRSVFEDESIARTEGITMRTAIRESKDYAEGRTAFLEKRSPQFVGE